MYKLTIPDSCPGYYGSSYRKQSIMSHENEIKGKSVQMYIIWKTMLTGGAVLHTYYMIYISRNISIPT